MQRRRLRTVAVTQLRVAHDVAEAVQRIEGRASDEAAADAASNSSMIEARAEFAAKATALMAPSATEATARKVDPIEEGLTARERQAWKDADGAIHDDMERSYAGRGLAHDPGLDDAGSIAARYAPAHRPR